MNKCNPKIRIKELNCFLDNPQTQKSLKGSKSLKIIMLACTLSRKMAFES